MIDPETRELGRQIVDLTVRQRAEIEQLRAENAKLTRWLIEAFDALEAIDSELVIGGHLQEMIDCALAPRMNGAKLS